MQSIERWILFAQIGAAIGLGIAFFLPFYQTAVGDTRYADAWLLFFWVSPVIFILSQVSLRWLKVIFCVLSILAGLITLLLLTFLATFKSTPLVGFSIAQLALIVLMLGWLVLGIVTATQGRSPAEGAPQ